MIFLDNFLISHSKKRRKFKINNKNIKTNKKKEEYLNKKLIIQTKLSPILENKQLKK